MENNKKIFYLPRKINEKKFIHEKWNFRPVPSVGSESTSN